MLTLLLSFSFEPFGVLCRNDDYDYDHDDDGNLFAHGKISFVIRGMERICSLEGYRGHGQTQHHTNRAFGNPEGGVLVGGRVWGASVSQFG